MIKLDPVRYHEEAERCRRLAGVSKTPKQWEELAERWNQIAIAAADLALRDCRRPPSGCLLNVFEALESSDC